MKLCYGHLDHWLNTKSPAVELRFAAELWNSRVLVQFFSSVQFSTTLLLSHSAMLRFVVECAVSCIPTSVLLCALSYSSALLLYSEDPQQSFCTVYRSCATPCVLSQYYCATVHSAILVVYTKSMVDCLLVVYRPVQEEMVQTPQLLSIKEDLWGRTNRHNCKTGENMRIEEKLCFFFTRMKTKHR